MTAVPPRPAAADHGCSDVCDEHEAWRDWMSSRIPAAPDATAGDGLRFEIGAAALGALLRPRTIKGPFSGEQAEEIADAVLALPALRDLLAAAARDAAKVRRCEALWDKYGGPGRIPTSIWPTELRRALDGTT